MPVAEKTALIERARARGFDMVSAVTSRPQRGDRRFSREDLIAEMPAGLGVGADYVVIQAGELEGVLGDAPSDGPTATTATWIDRIEEDLGLDQVIFERPRFVGLEGMGVAGRLIERVGSDANLGNVLPPYLNVLAQQRRGVGSYTALY